MAWILTIDVTSPQLDAISDRLWTLGTNGVAEVPSPSDANSTQLLAGFETEAEAEIARHEFGGTIAPVDPTAWGAAEATTVVVAGRSLTIDAGQSFGHGAHPTTQLCLQAMERHVSPSQSVLDVGCGSGVLSLAAVALGASSVTAIDIDPAALAATTENARTNNIELHVSATPIEDIDGSFEIVVINMLVAELEPMASEIVRVAAGLIILSGALIEQSDRWSAMFPGCLIIDEAAEGEWASRVVRVHE